MEAFAAHLYGGGYIRPGMTVEEARDILWTVNSPELYELLVLERGWAVVRYAISVADTLAAHLLP